MLPLRWRVIVNGGRHYERGARLLTLLPTLHTRRPLTVIGAAMIDIIADARTLPRRGRY